MTTEVKVPTLGESVSEASIGQWLKQEGEAIREGETIAILESEKATVDLQEDDVPGIDNAQVGWYLRTAAAGSAKTSFLAASYSD